MLSNIAPFFIVEELGPSVAFYVRAGFDVRYSAPAQDPFFAIVGRDETRIFLKAITDDVLPLPNPIRHHWAPWDAFVSVEQHDTLAAEFAEANIAFHKELKNTDDGLRGFEVRDNDGYVLFFGRPATRSARWRRCPVTTTQSLSSTHTLGRPRGELIATRH